MGCPWCFLQGFYKGLVYAHHRYLSPRLGHWLTADFRAPDLYDPTTFTEPYAYAQGNPLLFWDPNGLDIIHIGNGKIKIVAQDVYGNVQTLIVPQQQWIDVLTGKRAIKGPHTQYKFWLPMGKPDLSTTQGRAEYNIRANLILEQFFGPGTELTKGTAEITKQLAVGTIYGSLFFFGGAALYEMGAASQILGVRLLTHGTGAALSGSAIYHGGANIIEGIHEDDAGQLVVGTLQAGLGGLGLFGSSAAFVGEINAARNSLFVLDEAALEAYLAENIQLVAQRNTLHLSLQEQVLASGLGPIDSFIYAAPRGVGLPGNMGLRIPGRPTWEQLDQLTGRHDVEFGVTYQPGIGKNGGGGQYVLFSGTKNRVEYRVGRGTILIAHTHPGGTAVPSGPDIRSLITLQQKYSSLQNSSVIVPRGKVPVRFNNEFVGPIDEWQYYMNLLRNNGGQQ